MKSTYYLTHLKTVLLIAQTSFYLSGATIAYAGDRSTLSLGFVTPRHLEDRGDLSQGQLTVYSATDRSEDGGLEYYAHSSYAVYTADGRLFKRVENHLSATDETPDMVSLPIGSYVVEAQSEKNGCIRRLVTIEKGRQTVLHLDVN
jgi:hypothetical protein